MEAAPSYRNDLEIQFFGLRRSGNHGVIAWIAQQYDTPIVFLNNTRPFEDPFAAFRFAKMPNTIPARRPGPGRLETLRLKQKQLLLLSYENVELDELGGADILPSRAQWLGASREIRRVLLLRDFYNWFASVVRLIETKIGADTDVAKRTPRLVQQWLSYAREFLGETSHLGEIERISYNKWFTDDAYGSSVLGCLGVPVSNISRSAVPRVAGGSSFDGTAFSGSADSMDVLERWRYLLDPRYADLLAVLGKFNAAIGSYNRRIFELANPY